MFGRQLNSRIREASQLSMKAKKWLSSDRHRLTSEEVEHSNVSQMG